MPATMKAWGGAVLTVLVDGTDYSCYATEVNVNRSKNRLWDPAEAGSADVRLTLVEGSVSANTGQPGDVVKIKVAYGSTFRWLFTGRVQLRGIEITPAGDTLVLNCVDEFESLARTAFRSTPGDTAVGGGESNDTRIGRWLSAAGSTTAQDFDTSTYTCPATLIEGNALMQIQATAYADGGDFFVAGDGTLTFKAWAWQTTGDVPGCIFSDRKLHDWVPYSTARWMNDLDEVQNHVTGTRRPISDTDVPVAQTAINTASVLEFGRRGDPLDDLELADDTQVANRVDAVIGVAAFPNPRFDSIVVNPVIDPALSWPLVIPITYSTLVACNRRFEDGTDVSRYGHVIGELWRLTPDSASVEFRCSGTGTWDLLRPARPPGCVTFNPDGSISICDGYPCDSSCSVVLKRCDDSVVAAYPPGSLCTPGVVFPTSDTCYVCYVCDDGTQHCVDLTPESIDALLWLDAVDTLADREIDKITGVDPQTSGTTGFAGTRLDVIPPSDDAIDATLVGGVVAAAHSVKIEAASFHDGWTIDFHLWLDNDLDPGFLTIIDFDSVKLRLYGEVPGGGPVTHLQLIVVETISGVDYNITSGNLVDVPIGSWHRFRFIWDGTNLTAYMDGIVV